MCDTLMSDPLCPKNSFMLVTKTESPVLKHCLTKKKENKVINTKQPELSKSTGLANCGPQAALKLIINYINICMKFHLGYS